MKDIQKTINNIITDLRNRSGDQDEDEWDREDRAIRARALAEIMRLDGIPKRFRGSVASPEPTRSVCTVDDWFADEGWCLLLSGPVGVGKSFAAAKWLYDYAVATNRPHTPNATRRWYSATTLARMSQYGDEIETLNERATLVIDDLGVEYHDKSGAFQSKVDYLIDARYGEERRTLITSNLSPTKIAQRYGSRVLDRIRDGGSIMVLDGETRRRQ